jgi:hypothetical protein
MTGDVGERATCTTCQMAEDFRCRHIFNCSDNLTNMHSNYWTAQLYFKHPTNGSYKRVPIVPVQPLLGGSNGASGGLTVYYTQFDLSKDNLKQQKITAFQPVSSLAPPVFSGGLTAKGFRMTVGIPTETNKPHVGLRYQCLTGTGRGAEMPDFPAKPCTGGIFTSHHFPA